MFLNPTRIPSRFMKIFQDRAMMIMKIFNATLRIEVYEDVEDIQSSNSQEELCCCSVCSGMCMCLLSHCWWIVVEACVEVCQESHIIVVAAYLTEPEALSTPLYY